MSREKKSSKTNWESIFGFGGSFVEVMSNIFDVLVAGLLWILCSIPIITCGAASSALYHTIVRCVRESKGYIVRTFFKAFKGNLKPSLLPWTILLALTILMSFNVMTMYEYGEGNIALFLMILYLIVLLVLVPTLVYYCAALSRFNMPSSFHVKVAFYMVFRNPSTTLIIYGMGILVYILLSLLPILILIIPGPCAYLLSKSMEKALLRHYPKDDSEESSSAGNSKAKSLESDISKKNAAESEEEDNH